jgi:hypothetical protein
MNNTSQGIKFQKNLAKTFATARCKKSHNRLLKYPFTNKKNSPMVVRCKNPLDISCSVKTFDWAIGRGNLEKAILEKRLQDNTPSTAETDRQVPIENITTNETCQIPGENIQHKALKVSRKKALQTPSENAVSETEKLQTNSTVAELPQGIENILSSIKCENISEVVPRPVEDTSDVVNWAEFLDDEPDECDSVADSGILDAIENASDDELIFVEEYKWDWGYEFKNIKKEKDDEVI